jgi:O-antigen biosynthesis protein
VNGYIRACLESIKPWVDEMIVVDTGSTDATPEICRELGAQVYHFRWPDSFSIARNESLKYARGEWIFWMDSDDVIDAANGRKLRQLVASSVGNALCGVPPSADAAVRRADGLPSPSRNQRDSQASPSSKNLLGYVVQVHCPGPGDGQHDVTVVDHVKLFRNLRELRFEGRIHEQVLPNLRRLGGEVQFTDIFVVHAGADHSAETRGRKLRRDLRLLKLELRERPGHPFTLFNLGMTYADAGRHRRAIGHLRQSLSNSDPGQSQVRKAYALLASSYLQLGWLRAARRCCRRGLRHFPRDAELLFRAALVAHRLGRLEESERGYLAVLANQDDRHFSSIDRALVGFKARQNLAAVYTDLRDLGRAEVQWRAIVAEAPDYRDGWLGLLENLLEQGERSAAEAIAKHLVARAEQTGRPALRAASLVAAARLAEAYHDAPGALGAIRAAVAAGANDPLPREILCRLLFQNGETAEAAVELARLVELDGANAAAQHNLGVARLQTGDFAGAARALQTSLRLRPKSPATRDALAFACHQTKRNLHETANV